MKLRVLGADADVIAQVLQQGGARDVEAVPHPQDWNAAAADAVLLQSDAVQAMGRGELVPPAEPAVAVIPEGTSLPGGAVPPRRLVYYRLEGQRTPWGWQPLTFAFRSADDSPTAARVRQHLSICLLRGGLSPLAQRPAAHPRAGNPAWVEELLPACQRGLPCDDCGQCH